MYQVESFFFFFHLVVPGSLWDLKFPDQDTKPGLGHESSES